MTGFHRDHEGHWVAELDCGHDQHVRHDPPWQERPWVTTEEGRTARLGQVLNCLRCDQRELPEGARVRRRTPTFDQDTTPDALRSRHTTKRGVWAVVHVLDGELDYRIAEPLAAQGRLGPGQTAVMPPEVEHEVAPVGRVSFYVELFSGRPDEAGSPS